MAELEILYQDIDGNEYRQKTVLNFSEFQGISEIGGGDHVYQISQNIKKIEQHFHHFGSGFKRIKVDSFNSDDKDVERKRQDEQYIEMKKRQTGITEKKTNKFQNLRLWLGRVFNAPV